MQASATIMTNWSPGTNGDAARGSDTDKLTMVMINKRTDSADTPMKN